MKAETAADGSIHVEDRLGFLRGGLLICIALALAVAALEGPGRAAWTPLAVALGCAALASVIEDSDFRFDASSREVRWRKSRLLGGRTGIIPFADVDDVVVEVRAERNRAGLTHSEDCRVFLVTGPTSIALGSSNLDLGRARDELARPLLALLGKGDRALVRRLSGSTRE